MGKRKNPENLISVNLLLHVLVRVTFPFLHGHDPNHYNDGDDSDDPQGHYDVHSIVTLLLGEGVTRRHVWNTDNRVIHSINNHDVTLYREKTSWQNVFCTLYCNILTISTEHIITEHDFESIYWETLHSLSFTHPSSPTPQKNPKINVLSTLTPRKVSGLAPPESLET